MENPPAPDARHADKNNANFFLIIHMKCPTPKVIPQTGYYFNSQTGMCERIVPSYFTIALYSGNEVEPSSGATKNTLSFVATVLDRDKQPPKTPVDVIISLTVEPTSGGHDHGDHTRTRGKIAGTECQSDDTCQTLTTDSNGIVNFDFTSPEASGKHTVTVTCDKCSNGDSKEVEVKVAGLKPIPPSGLYALYETDGSVIGAVKNRHESNHYLTPTAANKLLVIAINYHHQYPNDPVLHINDASLMWGGKFDIYGTWKGKHAEHRRGSVVDIRANTRTGAIPSTNFISFEKFARFAGAYPHIENQGTDLQHYHLRLLNRGE